MSNTGRRIVATIVIGMVLSPLAAAAPGNPPPPAAHRQGSNDQPAKPAAPAVQAPQVPKLTAEQVVEKHVAARGGAQAWKAVETLQLVGKMEAGKGSADAQMRKQILSGKTADTQSLVAATQSTSGQNADKQVQLPFTLDVMRPNKTRLEIEFAGKTALQVYDGAHGWKVRPYLNRNEVEPFTADEAKSEAGRASFDGPLIDYAAKGTKVALEGVELVEGQPAYKLKVTPKSGAVQHVWIDAKTFLDVKVEGVQRHMNGKMRDVFVYQRDFRKVDGVTIPFVLETAVDGFPETHKMLIEKAAVNPKLDSSLFEKPHA